MTEMITEDYSLILEAELACTAATVHDIRAAIGRYRRAINATNRGDAWENELEDSIATLRRMIGGNS